jgi:spoIIIJ-associated protein
MHKIEIEAKSVEEATLLAAQELCCDPEVVDVVVVEEKRGFLGVGRKIKISASIAEGSAARNLDDAPAQRRGSDDPPAVDEGDQIPSWAMDPSFDPRVALEKICNTIMPETHVETDERDGRMLLDIQGDGSGIFIGRKGATLEALQFIINKMYLKQTGRANHIIVDSEGYTQRRISKLREKAGELAEKTIQEERPQTTEPLNAHDRRIIHTTLRDAQGVMTRSIGDGDYKRVQISLKRQ